MLEPNGHEIKHEHHVPNCGVLGRLLQIGTCPVNLSLSIVETPNQRVQQLISGNFVDQSKQEGGKVFPGAAVTALSNDLISKANRCLNHKNTAEHRLLSFKVREHNAKDD